MTSVTSDLRQVLMGHLLYWMVKVVTVDGIELFEPNRIVIRTTKMAKTMNKASPVITSFALYLVDVENQPINVEKVHGPQWIQHICYQCCHTPTGLVSAIYDHEYKRLAPSMAGYPIDLGRTKEYPAEKVWPELCAKGYTGSMPQLVT